ncbi:MAG: 4'-phosphopantetheinyl transferase family protein [Rhodothermales bacterium]
MERLIPMLSASEKERAERYYFDRDRNASIVSRATLRMLLGRYLGVPPADVRFDYGTHGKPLLHRAHGTSLDFNLSDTSDLVLYAFTAGAPLGVDVERVRAMEDQDRVAATVFSATEMAAFSQLSGTRRVQGFWNGWTRKEAFIKAVGEGMSLPLKTFDVTLAPEEPPVLLDVRTPGHDANWTLYALHPTSEHIAALAVRGEPKRLQCFAWSDLCLPKAR